MILLGDCVETLKELPSESVDSIVTDPPYGLSFMGKRWDYDVPNIEIWRECLRVLKPGGHMLAFFGTRTYHRGVVRIEDAGFEIRDQLQWIYGSGFPKSLDISKAIDKAAGIEREVIGQKDVGPDFTGKNFFNRDSGERMIANITAPTSDAAKTWQGFGTALKPANEPIVLARKPLIGTVAENVEKYGVGGLNIDGCRIEAESMPKPCTNQNIRGNKFKSDNSDRERDTEYNPHQSGRWPANVLFDEEAAKMLDEQSGQLKSGSRKDGVRKGMGFHGANGDGGPEIIGSIGSASRFFYVAKASKSERNAGLEGILNAHPTVKPIKLMSYLIKLITPPQGTVLDPFMGSGSTGVASIRDGFKFIGCELSPEYVEIAKKRIEKAQSETNEQLELR